MATDNTTGHQPADEHSIADFEALKTAIANGEAQLVEELVAGQTMLKIEKDYLLDLARLGKNQQIIRLLQQVPLKE
ncbi:hypothetical protein [Arsukibacterium sp.]|uniref:hypothetical protein n=1 Tax=Arsukibacterium sp. TaxID=1977258 RepID=UPI00299F3E1D|nr:hypothetical protein [Arsukibacterium sp.]MDX1678688.1 hypothetical protein [Arsukibacterium sp.]